METEEVKTETQASDLAIDKVTRKKPDPESTAVLKKKISMLSASLDNQADLIGKKQLTIEEQAKEIEKLNQDLRNSQAKLQVVLGNIINMMNAQIQNVQIMRQLEG